MEQPAGTRAHFDVEESADATIIRVYDEIDLGNARSLGDAVFGVLRAGRPTIVDLTHLTHIDSVGMHILLRAVQHAERTRIHMVLVATGVPLQLLEEIGMNRLVAVFPHEAAALAGIAAVSAGKS
jgi:anti-anti-sigma factor